MTGRLTERPRPALMTGNQRLGALADRHARLGYWRVVDRLATGTNGAGHPCFRAAYRVSTPTSFRPDP